MATKKKAAKKTTKKAGAKKGRGSASAFVRSMPATMPAKEVVAAAAKKGIKISEGLVYTTRAYDRGKAGKKGTPKKPGPKPKQWKPQVFKGGGNAESELKRAALAVGFPRARAVVEELEKKYMALLS
jgi:hypothetical protein